MAQGTKKKLSHRVEMKCINYTHQYRLQNIDTALRNIIPHVSAVSILATFSINDAGVAESAKSDESEMD